MDQISNKRISNPVANWLFVGAFLVAAIVVTGGITRLTNSGLSMVTWEPISGVIPPLNNQDWEEEFDNYKQYPEFQIRNSDFELEDFKKIFWWEYIHRLFARFIGLVFILPFFIFLFTKKLNNRKLLKHLIIIFLLGAFQGFLGWFMVSSGLVKEPRVNHIRLAAHLLAALSLFGYILWIGFHIRFKQFFQKSSNTILIRRLLRITFILLVIQIIYGAFMAGLKAGYFFPTFPKMGASWIPQDTGLIFSEEGLVSIFQHPILVQFIHRWIPLILFILVIVLSFRVEKIRELIPLQKWSIRILMGVLLIQVILGVYTILLAVPISLGVMHQFGAVLLFGATLWSLFLFRTKNLF